jgi:hypothetical protein
MVKLNHNKSKKWDFSKYLLEFKIYSINWNVLFWILKIHNNYIYQYSNLLGYKILILFLNKDKNFKLLSKFGNKLSKISHNLLI